MYKKDLIKSVHIRITEEEMQFLAEVGKLTERSVCEVMRDIIDGVMLAYKFGNEFADKIMPKKLRKDGECVVANQETNIHN